MSLSRMLAVHASSALYVAGWWSGLSFLPAGIRIISRLSFHTFALSVYVHPRVTPKYQHTYDYENETENSLSFVLKSRSIAMSNWEIQIFFKN